MSDLAFEATLLVIDMRYEVHGPNGLFVNLLDIDVATASEDGLVHQRIHLSPFGDDYAQVVSIEALILDFIDENFSEDAPPVLVAASMHDLLRYFEQSAPRLMSKLRSNKRIDTDTLVNMIPQSTPLYTKILCHLGTTSSTDHTLEVFQHFKEVYA